MIIPQWAKYAALGVIGVILAAIIIVWLWPDDNREAAQAEQTSRSTQAIATAASNAIDIMQQQTANERNIDAAVEAAKGDIKDAPTVEAIRQSVTASLCKRPDRAGDPACRVR